MYLAALHVILKDPNIRNEQYFVFNKVPYLFRLTLTVSMAFGMGGANLVRLNSKPVVSVEQQKSYFTCKEGVYTGALKTQQ